MRIYVYFIFAFFIILGNFQLALSSEKCLEELIDICIFSKESGNTGNLKDIKFAPMVRVNKGNENEWSYEFINEVEKYKDNNYILNSTSKISASYLENPPALIQLSPSIKDKISYDQKKRILMFKGKMSQEEKDSLLKLTSDNSYRKAINALHDNSNKDTIWLYTSFEKDGNGNIPDFFWNLIVSPEPAVKQRYNAEGYIVNLTQSKDILKLDQNQWMTLLKSRIKSGDKTIFTNFTMDESDSSKRGKINELWVKLLTANNMDPIYCERDKQEKPLFDYTFYFSKVSVDKESISLNYGYRISNSKIITSPGTVFGFAFDNKGTCLGFSQMKIE